MIRHLNIFLLIERKNNLFEVKKTLYGWFQVVSSGFLSFLVPSFSKYDSTSVNLLYIAN